MSEVLRISTAPDGGGGHFGEEHCWVWIAEIVRPTLDAESLTNGYRDDVYIISMRECVLSCNAIPCLKRTTSMAVFGSLLFRLDQGYTTALDNVKAQKPRSDWDGFTFGKCGRCDDDLLRR